MMNIRTVGLVFLCAVGLSTAAHAADCLTNEAGQPYATGQAAATAAETSVSLRRIKAERAAFLEALRNLKECLGDKAKTVTGWGIADVRYFDTDPVVEVDATARFDKTPLVTVLGSAAPKVDGVGAISQVRIETTQAARTVALRNAKEALDAVFPSGSGAGAIKKVLAGSLGACAKSEVSYWSDGAVAVKLTCGKGVDARKEAETREPPAIGKHVLK